MPSRHPRAAIAIAAFSVFAIIATAAISAPAMAAPPPDKGKPSPSATPTPSATESVAPTPSDTPVPVDTTVPSTPPSEPSPSSTAVTDPPPSHAPQTEESSTTSGTSTKGKGKPTPSPTPTGTATPTPTPTPTPGYPDVMAAAGDSITVAYNAASYGTYPQYSWSTGTATTLNSLLQRLQVASGTTITGVNVAALGAKSSDLAGQVSSAIAAQADYLTVEIGANDACTPTQGAMTSVADYQARINAALTQFHVAKADNRIFVASIPNLYRMWSISKDKFAARLVWASAGICQSMLANPSSRTVTDENRRLAVQARVDAYNVALHDECSKLPRCTFDDNAVANYLFTSTHISTADYFHPSIEGQRVLATVTWAYNRYPTTG